MDILGQISFSQVAIAGLSLIVAYVYLRKNIEYWDRKGIPTPHRDEIPYIGPIWKILTTPFHIIFVEQAKKYGKIYGVMDRGTPIIMTTDLNIIRQVLVKDFHIFTNRRNFQDILFDEIVKKFLTILTDNDWKRVRTIMTPTFTSGKMRRMFVGMNETATEAIEAIRQNASNGKEVDLKDFAGKYTLDVIARCCFATRPNSHQNPDNMFLKSAAGIFKLQIMRLIRFLLTPRWAIKKFKINISKSEPMEYFKQAVLHLIKERKEKNIVVDDFLQLLLEAQQEVNQSEQSKPEDSSDNVANYATEDGEKLDQLPDRSKLNKTLDENEIIANSILFLAAGYETTATLITMVLYNLALNQDIQQKLFEEISDLNELDYHSVMTATYLDAIIQETLRVAPPAIVIDREASQDYVLPGTDITIDKRTDIQIPVYVLHMDPENFPEPEKFKPERFLPENRDQIKPYSYLPFGGGPRNCIGMRFALLEAKLLIARLVLTYRFLRTDKTDVPIKFKKLSGLLSFKPLLVGIEQRA